MSTTHVLIAAITVAGVALAIAAGWFRRPRGFKPGYVAAGVIVLALVLVALEEMQGTSPQPAGPGATPAARPAALTVAALDPGVVGKILLTIDQSSGAPVLFSSRAGSYGRQLLWGIGSTLHPAVIPGSNDLVLAMPTFPQGFGRLEIHTVGGELVRVLTHPGPQQSDGSPALAAGPHIVYFVRTTWKKAGGGSSIGVRPTLMRVGLARGSKARVVPTPIRLLTVSVTGNGSLIAGQCRSDQVCILDPATGSVRTVSAAQPATMSDVTISPDGGWVAYSAPLPNPYGITEIYVYNVAERTTTMLTALPGQNDQPAWAPGSSSDPCLAFEHFQQTTGSSIRLACLSRPRVSALLLPVGSYPAWLP